jgi:solute:Na+ symporter, SSS family
VVKLGALGFVLFLSTDFAIDLQLLGGVRMLQTLPARAARSLHALAPPLGSPGGLGGRHDRRHLDRGVTGLHAVWDTPIVGATVYTGMVALFVNLVVAGVLTLVLGSSGRADELDETRPGDYDELHETHEPAPTVAAGVA